MTRKIAGMAVIVTGGARGIGRATAERLARLGASVAIGDLDADLAATVAAPFGDRVTAARLDVTDPGSWADFLAGTGHLGPWDALINNAGIMPLGSLLKEPDQLTRAIFDVNVFGAINGTKAVAPGMVERGRGHIVNVASAVGRIAVPNAASYSASKFAVVGFSEAIRAELAPAGVDVTVILPTVVRTELSAGIPTGRGVTSVSPEQVAEVIESALRKPQPELWVPRWVQAPTKVTQALPRRVAGVLDRLSDAGGLLSRADPAAREAYEERARRATRD
ncbi:SDR family oxidoreductase [Actinoplanes utahensis]|uniref:Short-chain dehydrogenase n=1 Tax=Actinoplanes utahensis TaxID=1869 RepID=A0A0A6UKD2_ACTUT|nr:SDR family oxidoreductase [Actinoplanes utahensis]KHD75533.1 short-chain dehydrogenase [Actinoplanes utahensis]GIF32328.1 putative short chain dehydrogenase/reductase [Actinoplanes utahensis]